MDFITAEEKVQLQEKLSELRLLDKQLIQRIADARARGGNFAAALIKDALSEVPQQYLDCTRLRIVK